MRILLTKRMKRKHKTEEGEELVPNKKQRTTKIVVIPIKYILDLLISVYKDDIPKIMTWRFSKYTENKIDNIINSKIISIGKVCFDNTIYNTTSDKETLFVNEICGIAALDLDFKMEYLLSKVDKEGRECMKDDIDDDDFGYWFSIYYQMIFESAMLYNKYNFIDILIKKILLFESSKNDTVCGFLSGIIYEVLHKDNHILIKLICELVLDSPNGTYSTEISEIFTDEYRANNLTKKMKKTLKEIFKKYDEY